MHNTAAFLVLTLLVAGCASRMGGPITQVGENTYRVTHKMGQNSPTKGVRQGVIDRATVKCAEQGRAYKKIREEMGLEGALSYTLTFTCVSTTQYSTLNTQH